MKLTGKLVGDPGELDGTAEWKVIRDGVEIVSIQPIINGFLDSVAGKFICGGSRSGVYHIEVHERRQKGPRLVVAETIANEINEFLGEAAGLDVDIEVEDGKSLMIRQV